MTDVPARETINDLIETCKDGEYGFRLCAEHTGSTEIRNLFVERSLDCRRSAEELQSMLTQLGGAAVEHGTVSGALHRGWVKALGVLPGTTDAAMLNEAERGEDAALARYRKALRDDHLPPLLRTLIERQMAGVQRNHDQVKLLRDRYREAARSQGET